MAATWVVLGYEGIKQFNKLRIKAIRKIIAEQSTQTDLSDSVKLTQGDYFHGGVEVLDDVLNWHILLRDVGRRTDSITRLVLDLVDQKMLLGNADKRATAKELCAELNCILEKTRQEITTEMPNSIMEILLEVDQEAPAKVKSLATDAALGNYDALNTVQDRKDRKSKFLAAPLMKTSFRSEYLKSELAVRSTAQKLPNTVQGLDHPNAADTNTRKDVPVLQESGFPPPPKSYHVQTPIANDKDLSPQTPPPRLRQNFVPSLVSTSSYRKTKTGPPQNVFQAREEIENREKGNILRRTRKDKLLAQHFEDRDIVRVLSPFKVAIFGTIN
jgi:hypothetical protein